MAIYSCNCKIVSRSSGRSSVGAAAYISGEKLKNEYDGIEHDYTKKGGIVYSEIILCENAPPAYQDRATLWNAVEQAEKGCNSQLARSYMIALPIELDRKEHIQFVRDFAKKNFSDKGMCVDFAIHDNLDGNPHAHIMVTMRPIEKNGEWGTKAINEYVLDKNGQRILQKVDKNNRKIYKRIKTDTTDWNTKEHLEVVRKSLADKINAELQKKNLPQRVDHRSLKEQGIERKPTIHEGRGRALEQRGIETDRGNINRQILAINKQLEINDIQTRVTAKEIDFVRNDIVWNNYHESIANIEKKMPTIGNNEKALRSIQDGLLKLYDNAKILKQPASSKGKYIEQNGRKIPYFEYNKNKIVGDTAYLLKVVKSKIETLEQIRQEKPIVKVQPQPPVQGDFAARREAVQAAPMPAQEQPQIDINYTEKMARELVILRNEFVNATIQSKERTSYQPNIIYSQQANEIESLSKTLADQSRSIEAIKADRAKLGAFNFKEKKDLQSKINNFESLLRGNLDKLNLLGVPDPSKVDEAIKEKNLLAAAEQEKARAANLNKGAGRRAEEVKSLFLEVVKHIPADQRQAVFEKMEQERDKPQAGRTAGRMEAFTADSEARRQLDSALKEQGQERQRGQTRTRWEDR